MHDYTTVGDLELARIGGKTKDKEALIKKRQLGAKTAPNGQLCRCPAVLFGAWLPCGHTGHAHVVLK